MMRSAIQEELDKNGITVCTTRGDSMEPLLANRRDIVTIQKIEPGQRLKNMTFPVSAGCEGRTMCFIGF